MIIISIIHILENNYETWNLFLKKDFCTNNIYIYIYIYITCDIIYIEYIQATCEDTYKYLCGYYLLCCKLTREYYIANIAYEKFKGLRV